MPEKWFVNFVNQVHFDLPHAVIVRTVVSLVTTTFAITAPAQTNNAPMDVPDGVPVIQLAGTSSPPDRAVAPADVAALIREIGVRRRVNVLFANPQSMFDGLQMGFTNVGVGNLTFRRRDLVV